MGDKLLVNERMFKSKAFTLRDVLAHRWSFGRAPKNDPIWLTPQSPQRMRNRGGCHHLEGAPGWCLLESSRPDISPWSSPSLLCLLHPLPLNSQPLMSHWTWGQWVPPQNLLPHYFLPYSAFFR
jgi:hypothetical protein